MSDAAFITGCAILAASFFFGVGQCQSKRDRVQAIEKCIETKPVAECGKAFEEGGR